MDKERQDDDLLELGVASIVTRGGTMGFEDYKGGLWYHGLGLRGLIGRWRASP
jgi:hypothetical protein